jgi:hypothetical protein
MPTGDARCDSDGTTHLQSGHIHHVNSLIAGVANGATDLLCPGLEQLGL